VTQLRIDTWRRIIRTDLFHREKAASHAFRGVISEVFFFFFLSICSFINGGWGLDNCYKTSSRDPVFKQFSNLLI